MRAPLALGPRTRRVVAGITGRKYYDNWVGPFPFSAGNETSGELFQSLGRYLWSATSVAPASHVGAFRTTGGPESFVPALVKQRRPEIQIAPQQRRSRRRK